MTRLADRVAVVTGAGSGIGRAIAERLAQDGAATVLAGRRLDALEATAAAAKARGAEVLAVSCDVADPGAVRRLMESATKRFGRLDILVNNAAHTRTTPPAPETVAELPEDWWAATLDVNLTGAYLCAKYALPTMVAQVRGVIVNVASTSGIAGNTNQSAYVASKHGLVGLTRALALDYGSRGIRTVAVCPGFIETDRSLAFASQVRGEGWRERKLAEIPLGRFGRAQEVAHLVAFLVSDEAAFISGAAIPIDGGTAARRG